MGAGDSHLKLKISSEGTLKWLLLVKGRKRQNLRETKQLELAVTLSVNQWNGQTTLQLMMVDARVDGVQLFNIRSKSAALARWSTCIY